MTYFIQDVISISLLTNLGRYWSIRLTYMTDFAMFLLSMQCISTLQTLNKDALGQNSVYDSHVLFMNFTTIDIQGFIQSLVFIVIFLLMRLF